MSRHLFCLLACGALVTSQVEFLPAFGATVSRTPDNVRYVGAVTCQSSMCHGGASPSRNQFTIWSHADFHSRSYATLVTARSVQIAAGAGIESATTNARCTICHAPADQLFASNTASTVNVTEGVSCEACHGGAASWLRSHTRYDLSYTDKVHDGMRDLRSAFVRANTCVACHQVIDPKLVKAGHPELTFEMDGQSASEPRHWMEKADWFGPKAWFVGQAVALREISEQISKLDAADAALTAEQQGLIWLMSRARPVHVESAPGTPTAHISPSAKPMAIAVWGNSLAQEFSGQDWSRALTLENLTSLAGTGGDFTDSAVSSAEREQRAERLVLGLDRLFKALHGNDPAPGSAELTALFDAVQDRNQFDPQAFAQKLQKFADAIGVKK